MVFLVTGCCGFIGSNLCERLLEKGHFVYGLDNMNDYYDVKIKEDTLKKLETSKDFTFIRGDITSEEDLKKIPSPKVIFHQAAFGGVRKSIEKPVSYLNNNVVGTVKLLNAFRDVEKFVFASSSSVYGEVSLEDLPVKEERKLVPVSPYALSKKHCEEWLRVFYEVYGIKYNALRYFNVYGPRQRPDEVVTIFLKKLLKNEKIQIFGDGKQTRDFTYVRDIANANILSSKKGLGVYNIASSNNISVNNLLSLTAKIVGITPNVEKVGKQVGDVSHTYGDITKANAELGFLPQTNLEEGIKNQTEWVKEMISKNIL